MSPTEIAQYALYASEKWRIRDGILPFLTPPEQRAFERFEQQRKKKETARPVKSTCAGHDTLTANRKEVKLKPAVIGRKGNAKRRQGHVQKWRV